MPVRTPGTRRARSWDLQPGPCGMPRSCQESVRPPGCIPGPLCSALYSGATARVQGRTEFGGGQSPGEDRVRGRTE